ncbi:MAG: hypothetical protein LBM99_01095 [Bacillales bacterium]|jgi:hypothetical protein|nr:hypothetical protein [Bacillales bacterium]
MKRYDVQPEFRWNRNRAISFLLIALSVLMFVFILNSVIKYVYLGYENQRKEEIIAQLEVNNQEEDINTVIVKAFDLFFSGEFVVRFPK